MKTHTQSPTKFFQLWQSLNHSSKSTATFSYWLHYLATLPAHVSRAVVTGLIAARGSYSVNKRRYLGLLLFFLGASLIASHNFFDPKENFVNDATGWHPTNDWFYVNWHFFLASIDFWYAAPLLTWSLFLLQPALVNRKAKIITMLLVLSFCVPEMLWLPYASSNEEYNAIPSIGCLAASASIILVIVLYWKFFQDIFYHKIQGNSARMDGLFDCPNLDSEIKIKALQKVWNERKQLDHTY